MTNVLNENGIFSFRTFLIKDILPSSQFLQRTVLYPTEILSLLNSQCCTVFNNNYNNLNNAIPHKNLSLWYCTLSTSKVHLTVKKAQAHEYQHDKKPG